MSVQMSVAEIQRLPRLEQIKLMELLWTEPSRNDEEFDAPAWHGEALRETSEQLAAGKEQVLDWS
jgi:hypothetical protein